MEGVLGMWRRLVRESGVLDVVGVGGGGGGGGGPIVAFFELEFEMASRLVVEVERVMSGVEDVLEERALVTPELIELVVGKGGVGGLLGGNVPEAWYAKWEGPLEVEAWLGEVVRRTVGVSSWRVRAGRIVEEGRIRLRDVFRPRTFLNALRQATARRVGIAMDELVLVSSLSKSTASAWPCAVGVEGLVLQGGACDGAVVNAARASTDPFVVVDVLYVAWVGGEEGREWRARDGVGLLPMYEDVGREHVVAEVGVECGGGVGWVLGGMAVFV